MASENDNLDRVYGARTPEESAAAYDAWAAGYDGDNMAGGFHLPFTAAGLVARYVPAGDAPILDAACGTGLVGAALQVLGHRSIVGVDLSEGMLSVAGHRGYGRCYRHRLGTPLPEADGSFAAAVCTGAFGPGHAPPETLEELARVTRPGGVVVFNTLSGSMAEQGFPAVMERLVKAGRWHLLFESADFRPFILTEPDLLARLFAFGID